MTTESTAVSFGQRLADLAAMHPDRPAIHFVANDGARTTRTWRQLDERSNALARVLRAHGVRPQTMVVVCIGNLPEHFEATFAAWKLGACVLPLSPRMAVTEQAQMLEAVGPDRLVVSKGSAIDGGLDLDAPVASELLAQTPTHAIAVKTPHPGKAIGSGGSTGRSKVIVDPNPLVGMPGAENAVLFDVGFRPGQMQLVAGPLYHNSPFSVAHYGLFEDHTLIVLEKFDAAHAADLVEEHRVGFVFLAPTMMLRISRLPHIESRDLSSLTAVYHTAMSCPGWLKRRWFDLVGPDHVYEAYGASENIGYTTISGEEWLQHPGSVGLPRHCEAKVLAEDGAELPRGQVGTLYLRSEVFPAPTYRYLGSEPLATTADGFTTVGDLGWLDDQGYLYIADRRTDLIITGGVNVYPAEVEAALLQNPDVADAVVIGLPDPEWGRRVHAIVQPSDQTTPPTPEELHADIKDRLQAAKRPKSYELMAELPRDESGKVRRSALAAERINVGATPMTGERDR